MPYFFNGRLYITPAVMSAVNDSAMYNQNLTVGNVLALIGESTGGEPNTPLVFGNPSDADKALRSGELHHAAVKAFDPSSETGAPESVVCLRVNPALQAALTLNDASSNPVIDLKSTDYGQYTNQIKVKIENGSNSGLKLTTQLGNSYYSKDNVERSVFSIQYAGTNASATMTVNDTQITLDSPAGTNVATVDLTTYPTIQQVVDYINTIPGFTATVLNGTGDNASLNALDFVTAQDVISSLYTQTANLQAVIDWFNGQAEGFVTATRVANAGTVPTVIPFTYLSGGSDGVTSNTDWSDALTTLQGQDVQWVTGLASDGAIQAMVDSHCQYMSTVGRSERRALSGEALGTTDQQAIADALALNSDRSSLIHLGHYDYNAAGKLTLYQPYMTAGIIAAAFAGLSPGTSMTNKSITIRGLERTLLDPTDTDPLIQGGVMPVNKTRTGYKVIKAITTWLNDSKYDKVEVSTGAALDFTARNVRNALEPLKGQTGSPTLLTQAVSLTETQLSELAKPVPQGPGVLVGDSKNPAFKNITASISGDVLSVSFQCSPGIPQNYVAVTIYAVPYSGTATA